MTDNGPLAVIVITTDDKATEGEVTESRIYEPEKKNTAAKTVEEDCFFPTAESVCLTLVRVKPVHLALVNSASASRSSTRV